LEDAFKKGGESIACVVIDPYVFEEPKDNYLYKLIRIAHRNGALVIFDEVVTGIRWPGYSVQGAYGLTPDLTCLGKTLGNGVPISCVGGSRKIMDVLNKDCFVSSTFGGDLIGIEAGLSTLRIAKDNNLPQTIQESGSMLMDGFNEIARKYSLDAMCVGNPARQRLDFPTPTHKAVFWQECLLGGVLLGGAQHTSLAHTEPIISKTLEVFNDALSTLMLKWDNPKSLLRGKLPEAVSTISSLRR
jgi:glutamate-1-semialdehyde aminotransferase